MAQTVDLAVHAQTGAPTVQATLTLVDIRDHPDYRAMEAAERLPEPQVPEFTDRRAEADWLIRECGYRL